MWNNERMKRPSKKDIKAALEQMKGPAMDESGKPKGDSQSHSLSDKKSNRRIGQKKV
jgi:hypothetical protein